ncbi:unnamed protein product [Ophioblennius macclurei]
MNKEQQQQHTKVERFLKLGYAHSDILRVLESLRQDAQTNDILEELIKTCHTRSPSSRSIPNSPKLVSRGCSPSPGPVRPVAEPAATDFRPVVIDGSNVAMSHGGRKVFSCRGLQLAVDWFWDKGLRDITMFVPLWRKEQPRPEAPITDQHVLGELEQRRILVYTPSRCVNGKRVVCYDDRYIIRLAFDLDGIVVSNDNYRDLQMENPQWKKFIEERLLMYSFVNDKFMPPDDPLGRNGPTIDDFLRKKRWSPPENKMQHCPYGKKCTYGVKCKFYHPERTNQSQLSVADELRAQRDRARNASSAAYLPSAAPSAPVHSPKEDDEAFGSMESGLSSLYLQDVTYSVDRALLSSSSGVTSYALSCDEAYGGSAPRVCSSAFHPGCPSCSQCHSSLQQQQHPPAWSSCPAGAPRSSETQSFRANWSLPRGPWAQAGKGASLEAPQEKRRELRSRLSTLFPQNTVEQVMNEHPDVSDMARLISLIQSYRSRHAAFSFN